MSIEERLTGHAGRRLRQRKVTLDEVAQTLEDPADQSPGTGFDTTVFCKVFPNGDEVCVVVANDTGDIVSVWRDSERR